MPTPFSKIEAANRLVAETYYGERGTWLYDAFEAINEKFFFGELPYPLISIQVTNYSGCLGWCSSSDNRPPAIAIHPTLFGTANDEDPWGIPRSWLGKKFVFDTLFHECIHASVHYRLGGHQGTSSHNNEQWISEVNRLAPLLGFKNIIAARQIAKRVPIQGKYTKTGKPKTVVKKVTAGNIPFTAAAMFPRELRIVKNKADRFYKSGRLPVAI